MMHRKKPGVWKDEWGSVALAINVERNINAVDSKTYDFKFSFSCPNCGSKHDRREVASRPDMQQVGYTLACGKVVVLLGTHPKYQEVWADKMGAGNKPKLTVDVFHKYKQLVAVDAWGSIEERNSPKILLGKEMFEKFCAKRELKRIHTCEGDGIDPLPWLLKYKIGSEGWSEFYPVQFPFTDHRRYFVDKNTKQRIVTIQPYLLTVAKKEEFGQGPLDISEEFIDIYNDCCNSRPHFKKLPETTIVKDAVDAILNKAKIVSNDFAKKYGLRAKVSFDGWYNPEQVILIEYTEDKGATLHKTKPPAILKHNKQQAVLEQSSEPHKASKFSPLTREQRWSVLFRDSFTCQYCGQKAPDVVLHADHVISISNWFKLHNNYAGVHDLENLKAACSSCNTGKGANNGLLVRE